MAFDSPFSAFFGSPRLGWFIPLRTSAVEPSLEVAQAGPDASADVRQAARAEQKQRDEQNHQNLGGTNRHATTKSYPRASRPATCAVMVADHGPILRDACASPDSADRAISRVTVTRASGRVRRVERAGSSRKGPQPGRRRAREPMKQGSVLQQPTGRGGGSEGACLSLAMQNTAPAGRP